MCGKLVRSCCTWYRTLKLSEHTFCGFTHTCTLLVLFLHSVSVLYHIIHLPVLKNKLYIFVCVYGIQLEKWDASTPHVSLRVSSHQQWWRINHLHRTVIATTSTVEVASTILLYRVLGISVIISVMMVGSLVESAIQQNVTKKWMNIAQYYIYYTILQWTFYEIYYSIV
jgi:hypothetical protein